MCISRNKVDENTESYWCHGMETRSTVLALCVWIRRDRCLKFWMCISFKPVHAFVKTADGRTKSMPSFNGSLSFRDQYIWPANV